MSALRFFHRRATRHLGIVLIGALVLVTAGCGFHPVGSTGQLPAAMKVTYVASSEPYGYLENALRRAIAARGAQVSENRPQAGAVLDIIHTELKRRVLAVTGLGQPQEYELDYSVRFRLFDSRGDELLAPQSVSLTRNLAYNLSIQLGSSLRQAQLKRDMQQEAVRLIMLRLAALERREKAKTAHP
ncbi:MAG: LPS assembly lipoprotein LptE [Gammaproteobacteria bacterium]